MERAKRSRHNWVQTICARGGARVQETSCRASTKADAERLPTLMVLGGAGRGIYGRPTHRIGDAVTDGQGYAEISLHPKFERRA